VFSAATRAPACLLRLALALSVLLPLLPLRVTAAEADATPPANTAIKFDRRFGLNQAWEEGDLADAAGAGWSRLTIWWSAFQPRGPRDWNTFATDNDSYIEEELRRGRELAGVVLHTPEWASASHSPNAVPNGLYLPWNHPQNVWGQFMRQLAERYRGRIQTWIIWNEVDIPSGQWRTWDGTMEDYVQLLAVAYQAVKAGNPTARVAHYGSPWWYDRGAGLQRFLDLIVARPDAAEHNYFFDIGNMHLYSRSADIPKVVPWFREQLALRGMAEKAVWIAETNVVPYDDPVWPASKAGFRASLDEQASYIVEALATYVAFGVERVGINRLIDGQDFRNGGEPFGMVRNDLSTRPAFRAFQVASRYFDRATGVSYDERNGVTEVVMERPGERITVVWSLRPGGQAYSLPAVGEQVLLVDKFGATEGVWADEWGEVRLWLPGATANSNDADRRDYVVGGDPVILVERYDGALASGIAL
jgi:hypothetical protein